MSKENPGQKLCLSFYTPPSLPDLPSLLGMPAAALSFASCWPVASSVSAQIRYKQETERDSCSYQVKNQDQG